MQEPIFYPRLFSCLKNYSFQQFGKDLLAGILVAIIALPLSIAFGIASGVTPSTGILTAVVGGFLVSFFSGSSVQIAGPTGAFVIIVFEVIENFGLIGLFQATLMAGVILVLMGISRVGSWLKFISRPVIVGFTAGIAVAIFFSQLKDALGLQIEVIPPHFFAKIRALFGSISTFNHYACFVTLITIVGISGIQRWKKSLPAPFIVLMIVSFLTYWLDWPIETIYSRFPNLNFAFAPPEIFPTLSLDRITELFPAAFTIALLSGIESLLCALVADGMQNERHHSNTELIAQGIANFFSPLLGGIPVTGAISRTAANIRAGGRTPIAGLASAVFLLFILLFLKDFVLFIPMPALAGILILIAYHMADHTSWRHLYHSTRADFFIFLATFGLTVFIGLIAAIQVGVLLSAFLFVDRMSKSAKLHQLDKDFFQVTHNSPHHAPLKIPDHFAVYTFEGALFFGASTKLETLFEQIVQKGKHIVIRCYQLTAVDATAIHLLRELAEKIDKEQGKLYLVELNPDCYKTLSQSTLVEVLPKKHLFTSLKSFTEKHL